MPTRINFEIEDFRIYFVSGSACLVLWILIPHFSVWFSSETLVSLNAWLRVGGQLTLAGCLLPFIPKRLKFPFVLVFAGYLTSFAKDVFAVQCDLAVARFIFKLGEHPSCLNVFAI